MKIAFDEEYKIRVLDPQKFSKAEELQKESALFAEKITVFNDKVRLCLRSRLFVNLP